MIMRPFCHVAEFSDRDRTERFGRDVNLRQRHFLKELDFTPAEWAYLLRPDRPSSRRPAATASRDNALTG